MFILSAIRSHSQQPMYRKAPFIYTHFIRVLMGGELEMVSREIKNIAKNSAELEAKLVFTSLVLHLFFFSITVPFLSLCMYTLHLTIFVVKSITATSSGRHYLVDQHK